MAVVGGKWILLSGRPRDLWHSSFHLSFHFLGAPSIAVFSAIVTLLYGNLEEFFARRDGFPLAIIADLGHGRPSFLKSPGGCSFGTLQH